MTQLDRDLIAALRMPKAVAVRIVTRTDRMLNYAVGVTAVGWLPATLELPAKEAERIKAINHHIAAKQHVEHVRAIHSAYWREHMAKVDARVTQPLPSVTAYAAVK